MTRIGILAIDDIVTTARYFERAAVAQGFEVVKLTSGDQVRSHDLTWLLAVDPFVTPLGSLKGVACPTIAYAIDAHQQLAPRLAYARYFDHVFVAQADYVPEFTALPHPSAHVLPLGCDPDVHFVPGLARTIDVGFVGKLGQPGTDRHKTLSQVLSAFPTNDWHRHYTPREMGDVYSRSKIVFNKSINGDLNMRFFEALAAGALLVTDQIRNGLDQMGTEGVHFVTYNGIDEAIDKIRHYLSHETERAAIAAAGQALAFSRHTYGHRLAEMLEIATRHTDARAPANVAPRAREALWRSEHMRMSGTSVASGLSLIAEGHFAGPLILNVAIGIARGVVRTMRQRLQQWGRARP
jgi:hypothetical protein